MCCWGLGEKKSVFQKWTHKTQKRRRRRKERGGRREQMKGQHTLRLPYSLSVVRSKKKKSFVGIETRRIREETVAQQERWPLLVEQRKEIEI